MTSDKDVLKMKKIGYGK